MTGQAAGVASLAKDFPVMLCARSGVSLRVIGRDSPEACVTFGLFRDGLPSPGCA